MKYLFLGGLIAAAVKFVKDNIRYCEAYKDVKYSIARIKSLPDLK